VAKLILVAQLAALQIRIPIFSTQFSELTIVILGTNLSVC